MNCDEVIKKIPEYIADILNDEEKEIIEEHMKKCDRCKEIYEQQLENTIKKNKMNDNLIIKYFCKIAIVITILCSFVISGYLKNNENMNEARISRKNLITRKINFNGQTKENCFSMEESYLSQKANGNWLNNEDNTYKVGIFKENTNTNLLMLKNNTNEKIYRIKYLKEIPDKSIIYVKWYDKDNLFIQIGKKYDAEKEFLLNIKNKKEVLLYDYIRE